MKVDSLKDINMTNILLRVELFVPEEQWRAAYDTTREMLLGFV